LKKTGIIYFTGDVGHHACGRLDQGLKHIFPASLCNHRIANRHAHAWAARVAGEAKNWRGYIKGLKRDCVGSLVYMLKARP